MRLRAWAALAALLTGVSGAWAQTAPPQAASPQAASPLAASARPAFTLDQMLGFPFVTGLVAAQRGDRVAWVRGVNGVRNVWVADGPGLRPRQLTRYGEDDGQELTQLTFSPDGARLVYVRGGDHDANWPAKGDLSPDPADSPDEPKVTIWSADVSGARAPVKVAEGDAPALSAKGELAYIRDHQVWTAKLDGGDAHRLLFDRGEDSDLQWSPDGLKLAFVSGRTDHDFIAVYAGKDRPLAYLAPYTGRDDAPHWSPDGTRIAFTREPGQGGAPEPVLTRTPHPWSIWVADAATGEGRRVWASPDTLRGSIPDVSGDVILNWAAGDRLVLLSSEDNWAHLYVVSAAGGPARLMTPGAFMVEDVAESPDRRSFVYSANTGGAPGDEDRRHLFRVAVDGGPPTPLTAGAGLEWAPVVAGETVVFVAAGAQQPPTVTTADLAGGAPQALAGQAPPADFPAAALVTPRLVRFTAADGLAIEGQLFERPGGAARKPGVIFVHGGPPRQMLLGWHYMDYYANAYAVNQYLAARGFVVLSVNYRLGIGYGHDFQYPARWGPTGAAEYQDVVAGAHLLQALPEVDPGRIGIWGGSYGGYLTALGLARNSDLFKAGVDFHGVHDWSRELGEALPDPFRRYEQGDRAEAMAVAWASSPDADVAKWASPVLLIQGDDDRNVRFDQTVDLARRLQARGVRFEEMVIPNEIHGFLRHADWLAADQAAADFLARELGAVAGP